MSYEISRLSNKGIVVLSLSGVFDTREVLRVVTGEVKRAAKENPGRVYRIIEARNMDSSFTSTTLRLIEDIHRATSTPNETASQTFVVGKQRLLDIVRYSGMRVCTFTSLE